MRPRDWVIALAALAALAASVFAIGGVLRWTQALVAVLTAVSVAATSLSQRGFSRISPLVALLSLACALTFVQLIPLPIAVTDLVSPTLSALRADGAELSGTAPWNSLSVDAGATLGALVMFLTLLGLALVTLRIATSEKGRYRIVASVAVICGIAASIAWIHRLFGLRALYGIYDPAYADPGMLGPLLNSNSLACLTAVGAVLGVGLAAHRRQPGWLRAAWLLHVGLCGSVTVATVSRGATLALLAGALVTIGVLVAQRLMAPDRARRRRGRFFSGTLSIGVLAGCLVVLVIYSNAGNVERQLTHLSFDEVHQSRSKFAAWRSAAELIEETPWVGVGRGAFEAPFTRVHHASGLATYAYLENEYLQAIVDWGVLGALAMGAALLWLAYASVRRWRDGALAAASLGGLAVVAIQSNVDFGLEFLGLAAPITALAATLAYVPLKETARPRLVRGLRVAHAVVLVAGGALLMASLTTTLDEDRHAISQRASLESVRASITRHPLDYYGYAVAAEAMQRANDPRAIRLLNHAMALHPTHPQLHRMAARMLFEEKFVSQAMVEYAAALRTTANPRPLLAEILATFPGETAASALPIDDPQPATMIQLLDELNRPDVARVWLGRILEIRPRAPRVCELLYTIAQRGDLAAAEIAGRRCSDRLPDYQTRLSLAKLLVSKHGQSEAIRLLQDVDSWQSRRDEKIDAWLVLCDANQSLGYTDEAKKCLRRLDASPDMIPERRAEILSRLDAINRARDLNGSAAAP